MSTHTNTYFLGPSGRFQFPSLALPSSCKTSREVNEVRYPAPAGFGTRPTVQSYIHLPSGSQMTRATIIFQHLNLLLSQRHSLKQNIAAALWQL